MEAQGKISRLDSVEVKVLDPRGSYEATWMVGKDITVDMVEKWKHPKTGVLYAVTIYRSGEPETNLTSHEKWLEIKAVTGG